MQYLIDGHNLIPKMGLRLDAPDDEMQLVHILQEFARLKRHAIEVYFDRAPLGQAGTRKLGVITAHFVPAGRTADSAIQARLRGMGKAAKNWTVVSSDREVQRAAQTAQAAFLSSEELAQLVRTAAAPAKPQPTDQPLSKREVEEWERIFREGKH
ncbi:MAG: NYN domain-containing protein [Anaerolineales bacterium]